MTLAAEQLARYREKHTIRPVAGGVPHCEHDLIRIHTRKSKGRPAYLHDADAIKALVRAAARELPPPGPERSAFLREWAERQ